MTGFNEFMSVGLSQCGNDRETFADLVELWNSQEDQIREMSVEDVKRVLVCP